MDRDKKAIGRTWSDLIYEVVSNKRKRKIFIWLHILMLTTLALTIIGVAWFSIHNLVRNDMEVNWTSNGFVISSPGDKDNEYFLLVHPHGPVWTDIWIESDTKIFIDASGHVNLQANDVVEFANQRERAEQRLSSGTTLLPEEGFDQILLDSLSNAEHDWSGPEGRGGSDADTANTTNLILAERAKRRVDPSANWGELLVGVYPSRYLKIAQESRELPDHIQSTQDSPISPGRDGYLFFIVNDYYDIPNSIHNISPYLYFQNNIGFFWVRVKIQSG